MILGSHAEFEYDSTISEGSWRGTMFSTSREEMGILVEERVGERSSGSPATDMATRTLNGEP